MGTVETLVGAVYEGRYAIERVLSIGGMGTLFKATQIAVQRPVCVRVINPDKVVDPTKVDRFITEARKLASFSHANVVDLIDFGQDEAGRLFLVRDFMEGERLYQLIDAQAPLDAERIAHICAQILDALAEAHQQGIVHRDLNPRNIFVTKIGRDSDFIKLLEFRLAEGRDDTWLEPDDELPHYTPPELLQEGIPIDDRCDLYSLGCILYEMLTGHVPFAYAEFDDVKRAQLIETPPPPHVHGVPVRGRLVDLITACLQKSPEDRPHDAAEALAVLVEGDGPMLAAADGTTTDETARTAPGLVVDVDPNALATTRRDVDFAAPLVAAATTPGAAVQQRYKTGPLLRHETTTIRHTGRDPVRLEADCDLPGAAPSSATFVYKPKRGALAFIVGGILLGGAALAAFVLLSGDGAPQPDQPAERAERGSQTAAATPVPDDPAPAEPGAAPAAAGDSADEAGKSGEADQASAVEGGVGAANGGDGKAEAAPEPPASDDDGKPDDEASKPVRIKLESDPSGAQIVNADGNVVATTPALLQFASDQPPVLKVVHKGYEPQTVTLDAKSTDTKLVLKKIAAPEPKATKTKPQRSTKPVRTKKKKKKKAKGVKAFLGN